MVILHLSDIHFGRDNPEYKVKGVFQNKKQILQELLVSIRDNSIKPLDRYMSPLDVWGMAFGCIIGWGVFAMPGTTFIPVAGPAGTIISMIIGMAIMLVIGSNFAYLMERSSMTGGIYSYTKEAFGRDHAFLCSWFMCLSYITIVFLNGIAEWIMWARAKADWYDPTVAAKDEFFGEREHEKSKEQKKLEKRYYW